MRTSVLAQVAVAAACAAGAAGFAPVGPAGNLKLRGVNAEARLNLGGPRLRSAPGKITMAAKTDARRCVFCVMCGPVSNMTITRGSVCATGKVLR
jgi:hypothetical protein